ncbi:Ref family recombination enhancement nuclease [Massilia sp.]|uniref:Ref family recombination enhancement nuclease n=1 Tax=Massilia sp. TaxID=1882437 RepID=UPI0028978BAB|nr:Ref family recombination enhancement nuclease [Massilia sp.]
MMRRSSLSQGKPLKPGKALQRKTAMSRGTGFKAPIASAGQLRVAAVQVKARADKKAREIKLPKPIKSRGMKGRPPTAEETRFMEAIAQLGCVACRKDGWHNPDVSVHHIDGRTKPGAHLLVLPLCAGHHQDGTGPNTTLIAVHPYKARFEARYGTQRELLVECVEMLKEQGASVCATQ